jgi:hypothetical protein
MHTSALFLDRGFPTFGRQLALIRGELQIWQFRPLDRPALSSRSQLRQIGNYRLQSLS